MPVEIERKFLVDPDFVKQLSDGKRITQGYIPTEGKHVVRPRIKGEKAFLTIKGESNGISCLEFEYEIPLDEAQQMIDALCGGEVIDKTRYEIQHGGHLWEVDVFYGANQGLIVAEVELESEDEMVTLPEWVTAEVTGDDRYFNSSLLKNPYVNWK